MKPEKLTVQKEQDYGHCHLMTINPFQLKIHLWLTSMNAIFGKKLNYTK